MKRFFSFCVVFLLLVTSHGVASARAPDRSERPMPRLSQQAEVQTVVSQSPTVMLARPKPRGEVPQKPRRATIPDLVAKYGVTGETAAVLIDVSTGEILDAYRGAVPMPPASVTKVLTTLYALDTLGDNFKFATTVFATGPVVGGLVQGDLVLVGSGDPALDSDELAELVTQLRDQGIRGITGQYQYFARALPHLREIDDGQPVQAAYNPGVSGLNLNFNRVYLEWSASGDLSLQARAERNSPDVRGVFVQKAAGDVPVYQYDVRGGADSWSIAENALKRAGGTWLPVRDPAPYASEVFRTLARQKGIALPKGIEQLEFPSGVEIARVERRPLRLVTRGMLHFSTNLTAEVIGMTASNARGAYNGLDGSAGLMQDWLTRAFDGVRPVVLDHSGLGDWNRIAALDMAEIMADATERDALVGLLRRHFVGGEKSKQPVRADVEVRAKTGTLNFVRGLSGQIGKVGDPKLAFAIFSADLDARAKSDGTQSQPRGSVTFNKRAVALEQAILRNWITSFVD